MTNIIATDLHSQEVLSGVLDLYVLEFGDSNSQRAYFHPGVDGSLGEVSFRDFDGNYNLRDYTPLPMQMRGVEVTGDGAPARPTLTVANVLTNFRTELGDVKADDIVGARLTRRRTLEKYLNTGAYQSHPPTEFPRETYVIDRIKDENSLSITYELASPFDLSNIQLPRRIVVGKYCSWVYRGLDSSFTSSDKLCGACNWNPNRGGAKRAYFNEYNEPIIQAFTPVSWDAQTAFDVNDFVSYNSISYRCELANTGQNPETLDSPYWTKIHLTRVWSTQQNNFNFTEGDYVEHANTVWKCTQDHQKTNAREPSYVSPYWTIGDICQKTLAACKNRFEATFDSFGRAKAEHNNTTVLPFGAFPGSDKFR